jgi:hypothetical protein
MRESYLGLPKVSLNLIAASLARQRS